MFITQADKKMKNVIHSGKTADTKNINLPPSPKKATNASKRPMNIDDVFKIGIVDRYDRKTWHFPDTLRCPIHHCGRVFNARHEAVEHFRIAHAEGTLWCTQCSHILAYSDPSKQLTRHFEKLHPHVKLSTRWKLKLVSTSFFSSLI